MAGVLSAVTALLVMSMTSKAFEMELVPSGKVAAQIGKELVLKCHTTGCAETPQFSWRAQMDFPLGGATHTEGSSSYLTMKNVGFENEHDYLCNAFCGMQKKEKRVKIDIYSFPSNPVIEFSDPLILGKEVTVSCSVPSVYPSEYLEITLKKGEETIVHKEFYDDDFSRSLQTKTVTKSFTPTEEDTGEKITCIAELPIEEMEFEPKFRQQTHVLDVAFGPRNTRITAPAGTTLLEKEALTLSCTTDSNPPARVVWKKQLADNTVQLIAEGGTLSIPSTQFHDSGTYICEVKNAVTNEIKEESISIQVFSSTTPALTMTSQPEHHSTPHPETGIKNGQLKDGTSPAPTVTILTVQPDEVTEMEDFTFKSTAYSTPYQVTDKNDQLEDETWAAPTVTILTVQPEHVTQQELEDKTSLAPKDTVVTLSRTLTHTTNSYAVDESENSGNATEEFILTTKVEEPDRMTSVIIVVSSLATVTGSMVAILVYLSRKGKLNGKYSLVGSSKEQV
ncbi:vascular cell adhesion protein 1 [Hemicordylus capensis]|uniref:vascular cell adhesion protein 1 n=1 Tax=Hemicordylus capensis TaxID=884348 RepID=UPI00230437BE|nr:vascular cell adhesion protein 1 [Hemicordylus capensis]XP_053107083.1 vascular cell adhesion protein 1 [Hemicordylus capensis]